MSDPVLAAITERAEAATPGEWKVYDFNEGDWPPRPLWGVANDAFWNPPADENEPWLAFEMHTGDKADAAFIAAARSDVPFLLARVGELEDELKLAKATARACLQFERDTNGSQSTLCGLCGETKEAHRG